MKIPHLAWVAAVGCGTAIIALSLGPQIVGADFDLPGLQAEVTNHDKRIGTLETTVGVPTPTATPVEQALAGPVRTQATTTPGPTVSVSPSAAVALPAPALIPTPEPTPPPLPGLRCSYPTDAQWLEAWAEYKAAGGPNSRNDNQVCTR